MVYYSDCKSNREEIHIEILARIGTRILEELKWPKQYGTFQAEKSCRGGSICELGTKNRQINDTVEGAIKCLS